MANAPARQSADVRTTREVAKFAAGVALLGIFWDAAVGHGLTWENDPYWSYWVTKTFLIFTVFGLGTAWLGIGVGRGAVITAVHTVVLTVYYWTFSPIGLPSHPSWLDLEHTWITGVPIHFGVIYLGYLTTLWLWRRRARVDVGRPARDALLALVAGVAIVVLAGGIASLAVGEWPGVTYFLVRLLITVPFLLLWDAFAGRNAGAALAGAVVLGFMWATYGEYVGPLGLPDTPLRVFDQEPPPATVEWLDYRDTWLIGLPIYVAAAAVVLFAGIALRERSLVPVARPAAALALLVAPIVVANAWVDAGGQNASVRASGPAQIERGGWFSGETAAASASLTLTAEDRVRKVTPLPPHDALTVSARVSHPDGKTYEISADKPLVEDPLGRYGTWWGVGIDVWHHGRSGVGTDEIPATRSEVAAFGLGDVRAAGTLVARDVPVHVMTGRGSDDDPLELAVGDPAALLPGLPDGHLRVTWARHTGGADREGEWARYVLGDVVLVLLVAAGLLANRGTALDRPSSRQRRER